MLGGTVAPAGLYGDPPLHLCYISLYHEKAAANGSDMCLEKAHVL